MITIALIGCSKTKSSNRDSGSIAARDLYASDLFCKRVEHVESRGLPWYILSAKRGLIRPSDLLSNYDCTITQMSAIDIAAWHLSVANQLMSELWYEFHQRQLSTISVEMHAGAKYCEPLGTILKTLGVEVIKPVANRGIGHQLAFYKST